MSTFDLEQSAKSWYREIEKIDVDHYYRERVLRLNKLPFVSKLASGIYEPKIFEVMRSAKPARFAAIDGWIRMMWQGVALPRWVREAIAVSVSAANNCHY